MKQRMIYQKDETKEKILKAAEQMILKIGLYDLQMKDLAQQAGISRNSLYRYFQDKGHLAFTIMAKKLKKIGKAQLDMIDELQGDNCIEKMKDYFIKLWLNQDFYEDQLYLAEFDAYYSGARQLDFPVDQLEVFNNIEEWDYLFKLIKDGQLEGSVRKDMDAHLLSVTLHNGFRSLQQRLMLRDESLVEIRKGEESKMLDCLLTLLLHGIKA